MKLQHLIILALIITGCNKKNNPILAALTVPEQKSNLTSPGQTEVWLGEGQSNMSGEAGGVFLDYPGITTYDMPQPMGLGYAFAIERAKMGHPVKLLQCGSSGTRIDRWTVGGDLYEHCVARAKELGLTPTGILYSQGEQDATNPVYTPWAQMFIAMIRDARTKFNNPDLPVVFLQTGKLIGWQGLNLPVNLDAIKAEQASVNLKNVVMTPSEPYTPHCGGWHYCTYDFDTIAHEMSAAFEVMDED